MRTNLDWCRFCGYPLTRLFHDFPCQPMRPELDGVMEVKAFPKQVGPKRCGGCAMQSASSADHLEQCSWLRGKPFCPEADKERA